MQTRTRSFVFVALVFLFIGLACNPFAVAVAPTSTPPSAPTVSPPVASPTTAAKATALPVPTTFTESTVKIDALYFLSGTPATGGTSAVQVTIRRAAQPGQLRVGFFEEEVGGTGSQWHATGWEAVILGSMLSGIEPTDYEFSFSVGGRIDGPSAGGLMTVGVLAALRGDSPRADATMTGTINPDGTIGPVGGIPQKLEGAAKKGKKLVLVPVGERFNYDMNKKQSVDVVQVGKSLGLEVREVSNIYDAYQQIVGKALPRATVSTSAPQFPSRAFDRLKAKTTEWYSRFMKERNQFLSAPKAIQQYLLADAQAADDLANKASKDLSQGLVAVAYFEIAQATTMERKLNIAGGMIQRYSDSGLNSALSYLQSTMSVQSELNAVVDQLQMLEPKTVSDVIAIFDAYSELGAAQGLIEVADGNLAYLAKNAASYTADELLVEMMNIAADYVAASDYVQLTRDATDVEMGFGVTPAPKPEKVMHVADALRRAAEANIALFEAIEIEDAARQYGLSADVVKSRLMAVDSDYLTVTASGYGLATLSKRLGEGPKAAAMVFGNSQNVYALSSGLIAKYYSLGAKMDKNMRIVSFEYDKALGEMLDFADQRARELINLCGDDIPIPAILYYENARANRRGSAQDQLTALNYYWQGAVLAQAEAFMSGKLSPK
jgi:hypothetical protein